MKRYMKKAGILILTQCILITIIVAQEEYKKTYKEVFNVNPSTKLSIANKFGKVDIKNWDKKSIEIVVNVIVRTSSQDKAEKSLSDIKIDISKTDEQINATTKFGEIVTKSVGNSSKANRGKIEINYSVMMPKTIPLTLLNKYGSVFIDELVSNSKIEVNYGNLVANKISSAVKKPETEVILAYSSGNIEECLWTKLNLKYSKLHIVNSQALAAITKYSKLFVDKGTSLVTESKYDSYKVGNVKNFVTSAGYCHLNFDRIDTKIDVTLKYSDLKVGYIPANFEEIKIVNKYGPCILNIDKNASYTINGNAEYGKIIYPEGNAKVSKFQDGSEIKVSGYVGKEDAKSHVRINSKYGTIKLNE